MAATRRARLTHAQEERRRAENRRKECIVEDHMRSLGIEQTLRANMSSDERVENKRLLRRQHQLAQEMEKDRALVEAEKSHRFKERQQQQEEELAAEMARLQWMQTRDEKLRQHIRENSTELRELEAKLRAGYMNRERAAQLAEKQALIEAMKSEEAHITARMKEEYDRASAAELEQEKKRWEESVQYHQELEKQLDEQEQKKQKAYEEFLKEKLMVDEIVRTIYEEDKREIEHRLEQQRATQKYVADFLSKREEWKKLEKEQMEEENARILEFAKQQQAREEERQMQKKEREEAKASVQKKLGDQIARQQQEQEEMERIRNDLYMEQQEELERQKERDDLEKQLRRRIDLQAAHALQMRLKAEREQALQEEEQHFREEMMAKFAEDDRLEQMNSQRRRMKQLEHRRAVERLIEDRRRQFQMEKEAEIEARQEEEKLEQLRKDIIEQERQKLLKEHATHLLGYLPKGVLRDEQEVNMLGNDFQRVYQESKRVDPFSDESWMM